MAGISSLPWRLCCKLLGFNFNLSQLGIISLVCTVMCELIQKHFPSGDIFSRMERLLHNKEQNKLHKPLSFDGKKECGWYLLTQKSIFGWFRFYRQLCIISSCNYCITFCQRKELSEEEFLYEMPTHLPLVESSGAIFGASMHRDQTDWSLMLSGRDLESLGSSPWAPATIVTLVSGYKCHIFLDFYYVFD